MFSRLFRLKPEPNKLPTDTLQVGSRSVPLLFVPHPRARRYLLRLQADGIARVTIPRRGSLSAAKEFASRNIGWLEQQFHRLAQQPKAPMRWEVGTEILFRGERVRLEAQSNQICFGTEQIKVSDPTVDLKPAIQKHLRKLAQQELPARVMELARLHSIAVARVSVRNQRTRWGSCSRRGTISLNWRLVMTPAFVQDYICLHELAHRRQMNHSDKFWQEVERLCPNYPAAERWLKQHSKLLR